MITLYSRDEGQLAVQSWQSGQPLPPHLIWVDAHDPSDEEADSLQAALGLALPPREERERSSALSRMFSSDGVSFMTAALITKAMGPYPEIRHVRFVLTEDTLLTVREIEPTSFVQFAARLAETTKNYDSGPEVLQGLLEEMVLRVAYNSELVSGDLDELSHRIFDPYGLQADEEQTSLQDVLRRLGVAADLNSQVHESLHSLARMVGFFKEQQSDNQYLVRKLDVLAADIRELAQQTTFLSNKITFQLDATLGMINVEQNMIMKILSVFTVLIMPPTLIGSIYGMNFSFMPELSQPWGYPLALALMVVCAVGPFMYFRRRRWL